ncbi:MAG: T9SS type A sorting domain-containing protein, partial [Bacteroidales bacterium]|nr:T9SS type A sorting domain-containing protein [Bacteroidales bacterium]
QGPLADETGHFPGWIEFYNSTDKAIDMAGMYVILNTKNQYQIPGGNSNLTTIPAKGHLVFFADGKPELGALHLGITLKEEKENTVDLGDIVNGENIYIDNFDAPALKKNQSFGRKSDGAKDLVTFVSSTPFDKNSTGTVETPLPPYTYTGEDPDDNPNTAVSESIASISMNVYPNPTSDYIKIASESENVSYTLYTIAGEKLLSGTGKEVNLTNLTAGMYVLKAYAGGALQSVKVMKR